MQKTSCRQPDNILRNSTEMLFLFCLSLYLLYTVFCTTTFSIPFPGATGKILLLLLGFSTAARLPFILKEWRAFAASLVFGIICGLIYYSVHYVFFLYLGIAAAGCIGIDYRKILRLHLAVVLVILLSAMTAALCGAVPDYVYIKDGQVRSSMGICYPTDFASYFVYSLIIISVLWEGASERKLLILGLISFLTARFIAVSETSMFCSIIFCCMCVWRAAAFGGKSRMISRIRKAADIVSEAVMPVLTVLLFALTAAYQKGMGIAFVADRILSRRIQLSAQALEKFGLKLFGSDFEMVGFGGTTFAASGQYNFLDSSYALIPIRYGIVIMAFFAVMWVLMTARAVKMKNCRLSMGLALIAIHSFMEHHFIDLNYNIFVILLPALCLSKDVELSAENANSGKHPRFEPMKVLIGSIIVLFLIIIYLPFSIAWIRTITALAGGAAWEKGIFSAGCFWILTAVFCCFARILIYERKRRPLHLVMALLTFGVCLFAGGKAGSFVKERSQVIYAEQIKDETEVLRFVSDHAAGKIVADEIPVIYRRFFPGMQYTVMTGENLARFKNISVLMRHDSDSRIFLKRGFRFLEISPYHVLYTNDADLIQAFENNGRHLTGFYSADRTVNLKKLAAMNALPYSTEHGIEIGAGGRVLNYGPAISLYSGNYELQLNLKAKESFENQEIARVSISSYWGKDELLVRSLTKDDFDSDGQVALTLPFVSKDYQGIECRILPVNGIQFNLTHMSYRCVKDEDVVCTYDSKGRTVFQEYYDLEGKPKLTAAGYFAVDTEYDRNENNCRNRYYGLDRAPVLINNGYAEIRRIFNNKRQCIRESYYGVDGKQMSLAQGQYELEKEYDTDGNAAVIRYLGEDGKPVMTSWGYAEIHRTYDSQKRVTGEAYFDAGGKPVSIATGQASDIRELDKNGNIVVQKYFGIDGEPVSLKDGLAEIHRGFNERNQCIEESYYGTNGRPVALLQGQYATEREFDKNGNVLIQRFTDSSGALILTAWGYAEIHRTYNEKNQVISEAYYGTDAKPKALATGQASDLREVDESGNIIVQRYFNENGDPVLITNGFAEIHRTFNEKKQCIKEMYYGTDRKPAALSLGQFGMEREYDAVGDAVVLRFLGIDGLPARITTGYAESRRIFNEKHQLTGEAYYDEKGSPMVLANGQASNRWEVDENGNAVIQKYYGLEGQPVMLVYGYAEIHRVFNEKHQCTEESYYDTESRPTALPNGQYSMTREYDAAGNVISQKFYGASGEPINRTDGYFEIRRTYDENHKVIEESRYDKDGNPVKS